MGFLSQKTIDSHPAPPALAAATKRRSRHGHQHGSHRQTKQNLQFFGPNSALERFGIVKRSRTYYLSSRMVPERRVWPASSNEAEFIVFPARSACLECLVIRRQIYDPTCRPSCKTAGNSGRDGGGISWRRQGSARQRQSATFVNEDRVSVMNVEQGAPYPLRTRLACTPACVRAPPGGVAATHYRTVVRGQRRAIHWLSPFDGYMPSPDRAGNYRAARGPQEEPMVTVCHRKRPRSGHGAAWPCRDELCSGAGIVGMNLPTGPRRFVGTEGGAAREPRPAHLLLV